MAGTRSLGLVGLLLGMASIALAEPEPPRLELEDEQLVAALQEVERGAVKALGRAEGRAAASEAKRLRRLLTGAAAWPRSRKAEAHAVCVFKGDRDGVEVRVTARHAPIVLVLVASLPVRWVLSIDPQVRLKKIVVSGGAPVGEAGVAGAPSGVPIEDLSGRGAEAWSGDPGEVERLERSVGTLSSLQGWYAPPGTFLIATEDAGWRAAAVRRRVEALLARARRPAWERAVAARRNDVFRGVALGSPRLTPSTIAGPLPAPPRGATKLPHSVALPPGTCGVAVARALGKAFAITDDSLREVDLKTGATREVTASGAPELTQVSGVAFDARRGRVVVATSGPGGVLCAYEPGGTWTVLRRLGDDLELPSLGYDPAQDALLAVQHYEKPCGSVVRKLLRLNPASGAIVSSVEVQGLAGQVLQIVPLNAQELLLVVDPPGISASRSADRAQRIVIERATGRVVVVCEARP